jgi:predicted HicB family RNase H-like nuclease
MLKYKGYVAAIEFDNEADIFHGEVINMSDIVTFQGRSIDELRRTFKESVDEYLAFCKATDRQPIKPFSGKMLIRTSPDHHRIIAEAAAKAHMSVNQWAEHTLFNAAQRS